MPLMKRLHAVSDTMAALQTLDTPGNDVIGVVEQSRERCRGQ